MIRVDERLEIAHAFSTVNCTSSQILSIIICSIWLMWTFDWCYVLKWKLLIIQSNLPMQSPALNGHIYFLSCHKCVPLYRGHLFYLSQKWPLNTCLTVVRSITEETDEMMVIVSIAPRVISEAYRNMIRHILPPVVWRCHWHKDR